MDLHTNDIAALTVGQEVAYGHLNRSSGGFMHVCYSRVAKINGYGHVILESGKVFDKHGTERNTSYAARLLDAQQTREYEARKQAQRDVNAKVRDIQALLDGRRTGARDYKIDEATKAELLRMVNEL